jgi:predicted MPP superfamily phosphohydrolase
MFALIGGGVITAATMARVYRGGTAANDHAVALLVAGCIAIYPLLWWGAMGVGVSGPAAVALGVALSVGAVSIYGLFHVLDRRRDAGRLMFLARLSQPALAFSLWCGLLLILRGPVAVFTGAPLLWPGPLLLLPLGLSLWGWAWTWLGHRVREHVVPVAGLPRPVRIVQLSDLHVSPIMRASDLYALVDRVNALAPDLVVVTGDHVMPFSEDEHAFLIDGLARLRAPTFACNGNHDLPVAARLRDELAAVGVPVLIDEARTVTLGPPETPVTVELAGVEFHWRDARAHLLAAVAALPVPDAHARVLLAHDPRLFAWVPDGRFHLVLSGHTHGGQVGTDMFGVPWSILRPFGVYDQGRWDRGGTRLWVHRGNWHTGLPPRMGIAGEIVVHRLVAAAAGS